MERIGIYGGTFNPPHIGHIQAAKQAVTALGLSKLLLIPDRIAPHKVIPDHSPSGEQRLSNFLLWQCAYAEFYFTDALWPDFDEAELDRAVEAYHARDRRFGGVKK